MKDIIIDEVISRIPYEQNLELEKSIRLDIREQQLLQMGFKKNEHQQCFSLYRYDNTWTIDFWDLENFTDEEWEGDIEYTKYNIECVKRGHKNYLREHEAYDFAVKENKKQLLDKLNHYKSNLQEETKVKLNRLANKEKIRELEIRIETIKELMN